MNQLKKIILAAIIFLVIAEIVYTAGAFVDMPHYYDEAYFGVWSKIMMPAAGPPPAGFYYLSILFSFVNGLFFAGVYYIIKGAVPGSGLKKGVTYGFFIFLLATIPSMLSMMLIINLPMGLVVSWAIQGLIVYLIAGLATEKLIR